MKFPRENALLYLVTDSRWTQEETLASQVEKALRGGVTAVQYRNKNSSEKEFVETAFALKKLCRQYSVPFIINDNPLFAKEIGADGVHVGQQDIPVCEARILLGDDKIVGASAHSKEEALAAEREGADYIGVGAVFGSKTKLNTTPLSRQILCEITEAVGIPVVAIGGIGSENAEQLAGCGIDGIAVISAILSKPDIRRAAGLMLEKARKAVQ